MGDKRNTRKPKAPTRSKPVATPSRSPSTRKRKLSMKAAESYTKRKKGPVRLQLEDEGVSQDDIAEDILADLELEYTSGKAAAPSHYSENELREDEDSFEDGFEGLEEFNIESDGDEEDEPASVPRIDFRKKKSNNLKQTQVVRVVDIPFEVPYDGRYKEMMISSRASWSVARVAIGKRMARDPASLSLGYINPFKPRKSGKPVPMSLETEDEWDGLIEHVNTFLKEQQAKNRGKGAASKAWCITLVDLKKDTSTKANRKGVKSTQKTEPDANDEDSAGEMKDRDHHILGEIARIHHCDRCAKACWIDEGPPVVHRALTMEHLSIWTSLVKLNLATKEKVPEVLRNRKQHDQHNKPPSVKDPAAGLAQIQSQNGANPAMAQFLMQGRPMFGFPDAVPQYPMPNYGMPYPYHYPPPHGPHSFPYPQYYNRKRRQVSPTSDPSDDVEAVLPNIAVSYPLVSDWLQGLTSDAVRGRDNIDYSTFAEKLTNNGILRLDDLTRFSQTDLCNLTGMNIGTAARIADWAKADKGSLDGQDRKGKKMRIF